MSFTLVPLPTADDTRPVHSYGMLSTFPPTACGIATFAAALASGLEVHGSKVGIVRIGSGTRPDDPMVVGTLESGARASVTQAIETLDRFDVAIVQHEYGIYGGADGEEVLEVLEALTVPSVVVAHTVLEHPTAHQRHVLERVVGAATVVVVMTEAARVRLCSHFDVGRAKVMVIPHGAAAVGNLTVVGNSVPAARAERRRQTVLTWGLLGPGKGIEWAIEAMAQLTDIRPIPRYVVAGRTHPKVAAATGEDYREMLVRRAHYAGLEHMVEFDPSYRDLRALAELIRKATVVVLPYDSPDQVTSGVLVDAIAAGRPVVATAFPHAVELLSSGAGLVVPRCDPDALAAAIRRVLTEPGLTDSMAAEARRLAPELSWPAVAGQYAAIGAELADRALSAPT